MSDFDPPSYEEAIGGAGGPAPSAPPSVIPAGSCDFEVDIVPGYEAIMSGQHDVTFEAPPPYTPLCLPTAPPPEIRMPPPYISEDMVRQALMDYSKKHSFFSSKVATEMALQQSQAFHTHRYRLKTFTESRRCRWVVVCYDGEAIHGVGPIPKAWDIPVQVPNMYQDGEKTFKVPNTNRLQTCGNCKGTGKGKCPNCGGRKRIAPGAQGSLCLYCFGSGSSTCERCDGQSVLLKYLQLAVKWKNNSFEFVADHKSDFPSKHFKKVKGEVVFFDEQMSVFPVTGFPDPSINEASQNAIRQHRSQSRSCKILKQKHCIEWLPLTKVEYIWRDKQYDFFVYGKENKAYAEEYPMVVSCVVM